PTLAYDPVRQRVVLFGGRSSPNYLDDTWTWDGSTWTAQPSAARPLPRTEAAMAFDEARGVVVLFGGRNLNAVANDTWTWNGAGWPCMPAGSPASRGGSAGVVGHRTRQRVVLAGGSDGSRNANAEVWEWDGSTWTNSLPALPEARDWPGPVYDPDTDRLLLVG